MSDLASKAAGSQDTADRALFESYLSKDLDQELDQPAKGDLREGIVVERRPTELLVNIGSKRDGVVPQSDLTRMGADFIQNLAEGQKVHVVITKEADDDGIFTLSLADAVQQRDWIVAKEMMDKHTISKHKVLGHNKGGLTIEFGQLRGFVPASHLWDLPRNMADEQRQSEFDRRVGQQINVVVIEVDPKRRRLVMSQQKAEAELRNSSKENLLKQLQVGAIVTGTVRSLRPFGAFVDLGGIDGLLHVSEIGWGQVAHPQDVLKVGQKIEVQVMKIDPTDQRVALSRKRAIPNPWEQLDARYPIGSVVPATITRIVDFGAFAQLEPGVEGLVHVSEIADITIAEPLKSIQVGDTVRVKVLRVDGKRQRVGLSIRQSSLPGAPEPSKDGSGE